MGKLTNEAILDTQANALLKGKVVYFTGGVMADEPYIINEIRVYDDGQIWIDAKNKEN